MGLPNKDIRLYKYDRGLDQYRLPRVLREDLGPGARGALRVLAERRAMEAMVGPQSYQTITGAGKKSFNALAEDNRID